MRANIINLNFIIFINNGLLINSFSDSAKLASVKTTKSRSGKEITQNMTKLRVLDKLWI